MKKLKFLAFALFTVLACVSLASCSDDDKDKPASDVSIIGLWKFDGENQGYEFQINGHGIFYDKKIELTVNHIGRIVVIKVHSKITFSIARNVIMIGLLSKRGDVVTTTPRLAFLYRTREI